MPNTIQGNKYIKKYSEEDVQKAISAILNGMSKHKASECFGVPRSTLQFRLSNNFIKTKHGPNPVLMKSEEDQLVTWILECCKKGFPCRKEDVQASVKHFLDAKPRSNSFRNNFPGDGWYKSFLKRNPIIVERTAESVTRASACVTESNVRNWFKTIEEYLVEENLFDILRDSSRIYNGDETFFSICPKLKQVLAPKGSRNVYETDHGNSKLNLTVFFMFSANGEITPPFIVYPYVRLPATIAHSVPDSWGIGGTKTGWMTADLFVSYLKNILHPHLVEKQVTFPIIVFVDGHSSHITLEVSDLCTELKIILLCLYPNSTRFLQPADVAAFKPIKNLWKKAVIKWRQDNPSSALTMDKMAPNLKFVFDEFVQRSDIIQKGFRACGLFPWNPDAVDYSKCLGSNKQNLSNQTRCQPRNDAEILYQTFKDIVGDDIINEFQCYSDETVSQQYDESTLKLFKLYKEFGKSTKKLQSHTSEQNNATSTNVSDANYDKELLTFTAEHSTDERAKVMGIQLDSSIISEAEIIFIDDRDNILKDTVIVDDSIIEECLDLSDINGNSIVVLNKVVDVPVNNSQIDDTNQVNDDSQNKLLDEPVDIASTKMDKLNTKNFTCLELNDKPLNLSKVNSTEFKLGVEVNKNVNLSTVELKDFLNVPKSPKRKGKMTAIKKSFAITSEKFKKEEKEKLEKKALEEKRKADNKQLKLQKKLLAEQIKKEKEEQKKENPTIQKKRGRPKLVNKNGGKPV